RGAADLAYVGLNAGRPSAVVLATLQTQHASEIELDPYDITWFLALNTRMPPFDNLTARRALNFAVDRQRLTDLTVGHTLGQATCQVLAPALAGYRRYCPYTLQPGTNGIKGPDLARARQLVRSSGTYGQKVTIWIGAWTQYGTAVGKYLTTVLDSLGYRGSYRV